MPGPLYGYAPPNLGLLGSAQPSQNYTNYSGYNPNGLQDMGPGNATGSGYSAATQAAVDARNNSGQSTLDTYINGDVSHLTRDTPKPNTSANAPAFQSAFQDDPFYQRSDVAPAISATNRDVLGGGAYGVRNWMRDHPVGTIAAFIAAAAGGSALAGGGLTGTAGAGAGSATGASGAGSAGVGFGGAGTGGIPADLAANFAGTTPGLGAAGNLAASGAIQGGAGSGIAGSLGGSGLLSQANVGRVQQLSGLLNSGSKSNGGQQQQIPYVQPVLGNQQPQQQSSQQFIGLPTQTQMPLLPTRGYTPHNFYGATVWS